MATPLNIPRKGTRDSYQPQRRSPSPLRQSTSFEEDRWDGESATSSLVQLATSLANRVGPGSRARTLPTDEELEAEAARAREESRREAERILTQEAEDRKMVEDRLRGLLDSTRHSPIAKQPLSASPGQASPLQIGTPLASSPRDGGSWWAMAKAKLTPTKDKDPLTPAQQLVQDTRNKEKKDRKGRDQNLLPDPSYLNLSSSHPYTPSPSQSPIFTTPTKGSKGIGGSPYSGPTNFSDDHCLYIQKLPDGALDVSTTLIGIAKRFEKLEKWTVSHVRALEERMSDVERWLVEKEEEKERDKETRCFSAETFVNQTNATHPREPGVTLLAEQVSDIKYDMGELKTRVGVLGREVARLAVSSPPQSSAVLATASVPVTPEPIKQSAVVAVDPVRSPRTQSNRFDHPTLPEPVEEISTRRSVALVAESPSISTAEIGDLATQKHIEMQTPVAPADKPKSRALPPKPTKLNKSEEDPDVSPSTVSTYTARTKLPYPSGDYTSQPNSPASPPLSPRNSIRSQHQISGLPRSQSPFDGHHSPTPSGLPAAPPHKPLSGRPGSSSPTPAPRKRYTVALGKPITSPPASETGSTNSFGTQLERAFSGDTPDLGLGVLAAGRNGPKGREKATNEVSTFSKEASKPSQAKARSRPQSSYGAPSVHGLAPTAPLRPRVRSKSTDKIGLNSASSETFKDPYLERKQARDPAAPPRTPVSGRQKVPVDQLVKFFDGGN